MMITSNFIGIPENVPRETGHVYWSETIKSLAAKSVFNVEHGTTK
jgi:hypothetical protein